MRILDPILDVLDGTFAWLSSTLGQLTESYCQLETADSQYSLAAKDGSLVSIIKIHGATFLIGPDEFERMHARLTQSLQTTLARPGYAIQVYFSQDGNTVKNSLEEMLFPAKKTAERLSLSLNDLFNEKIEHLAKFCADEAIYIALWSRPNSLTKTQIDQSIANRKKLHKSFAMPPIRNAQNFLAAIPELRDLHNSFVRSTVDDLNEIGLQVTLLDVHQACKTIRNTVDKDFTALNWRPYLPGDKIPMRETNNFSGDISDILWPPLHQQLIPRDGEVLDLRTCRIGDRIYGAVFIDLFPQKIQEFGKLFRRVQDANIPWRISYLIESEGLRSLGLKESLSSILSFASTQNKLIKNAIDLLRNINTNTDNAIVKLRVAACTWAKENEVDLLRTRIADLAKAIQGWGQCETAEISGDSYGGALSSCLGLSTDNLATAVAAPLSDVTYMLPFTRPASPWENGAVLFRSIDGKPWPYQPGSSLQTTWIDLVYARPGSGKSVLSNSINLALCLSSGIQRLPRIAIVDIGPSSSGLISLLKEALPKEKQHLVAYHRLKMIKEMAINPFDTQLGCRTPTPIERAFLVNFLTLLATPIGEDHAYDGITNMCGLIIDELYTNLADNANPHSYAENICPEIDAILKKMNVKIDEHSTWWEVTDILFKEGRIREAHIAQRYAMPLLADAAAICRSQSVEDLYGKIIAPTGETLITAFNRMISSAVREYPILSQITAFDLGEARVVSLDLDEVAKSGGEAADRQTSIMYMLARYVLAKDYYLTEDLVKDVHEVYKDYHGRRVIEIREDPKRIVFDEFHRTSKAKAVRDQVIVDMREGRKWKVQITLLSQSLDDFDPVMIEFATAVFIMDAGPKQAIEKSVKVFGLSETSRLALATKVHGPKAAGATFLAQFATKDGVNTQLITSTIGPIELWAFNTTAEDVNIRNALYKKIGASETRTLLASLYPTGSAAKAIEERLNQITEDSDIVTEDKTNNIVDNLIAEILDFYHKQAFNLEKSE